MLLLLPGAIVVAVLPLLLLPYASAFFPRYPCLSSLSATVIFPASPRTDDDGEEYDGGSLSSEYMMRYDRHRINLSGSSLPPRGSDGRGMFDGTFVPFGKDFARSIDRARVSAHYRGTATRHRIVEDDGDVPNSSSSAKSLSNIRALVRFWDVVGRHRIEEGDGAAEAVSFIDAPEHVLRGCVEIYSWWEMFMRSKASTSEDGGVACSIWTVVYDEDAPVPSVVLERSTLHLPRGDGELDHDGGPSSADNEDIVHSSIRSWVSRLLVKKSVCPFTKSPTRSGQGLQHLGVPVADIAYVLSRAGLPKEAGASLHLPTPTRLALSLPDLLGDVVTSMADDMLRPGPKGTSSILLSAPAYDTDFDIFGGPLFAMLEASMVISGGAKDLGVVCFHPKYRTSDGTTFPGFGHMHSVPRLLHWVNRNAAIDGDRFADADAIGASDSNTDDDANRKQMFTEGEAAAGGAFQRRTPHAVVNVLWASQLEKAEGQRETGALYARNLEVLVRDIGLGTLREDLELERQGGRPISKKSRGKEGNNDQIIVEQERIELEGRGKEVITENLEAENRTRWKKRKVRIIVDEKVY